MDCAGLIQHAHGEMNISIEADKQLTGTIDNLVCSAGERAKLRKLRARGFDPEALDEETDEELEEAFDGFD